MENETSQGTGTILLDPTKQAVDYDHFPLERLGRTHFIGIGGAGMSVLAEMLLEKGIPVSGSDRESNSKTERLEALGATIYLGQKAQNVAQADTVVWSSAIKPDNPEIVAAHAQGVLLMHRSDLLALLMAHSRAVTVAGAHGKTTTSAMAAQILVSAGSGQLADPSFAIGGSIRTSEGTADGGHAGKGAVLVAEADESDGSFEKYRPFIAIITNVEPDHLDHYGSAQAFHQAFLEHAGHASGHVVLCGDDPGALDLLKALSPEQAATAVVYSTQPDLPLGGSPASFVYIGGEKEAASDQEVDPQVAESFSLVLPPDLMAQSLSAEVRDSSSGKFRVNLRVPGIHNARNAAAAIIAAVLLGVSPQKACQAAFDFYGAKRRFEKRGEVNGVTVVDDYAHHPTEISALLQAARRRYPQAATRVVFQPHLYSRTHFFAREFAQALSLADDVIVTGIFPAREKQEDWPQVGPDIVVSLIDQEGGRVKARSVEDMDEAGRLIAADAQPGDLILTVGAGSITQVADTILDALKDQA